MAAPAPTHSIVLLDADTIDIKAPWHRPLDYMLVDQYCESLIMGASFPPILVQSGNLRLIGGLHRLHAYQKQAGNSHAQVPAILIDCPTDADALIAAAESNSTNGKRWSSVDMVRLIILADKEGIPSDVFSKALFIGENQYRNLSVRRWTDPITKTEIPVKAALSHLIGMVPTPELLRVNRTASNSVLRMSREIIQHLEADAVDWHSRETVSALHRLMQTIDYQIKMHVTPSTPAGTQP